MTTSYEDKLRGEADLWGAEAVRMAEKLPPDWRYHRHLLHNVLIHAPHIEPMLARVRPGMRALELGCGSGWLTLALAQAGADATGIDISEGALNIAREYATSLDDLPGSVRYEVADLNALSLPPETYDLVVIKGTLHHLINMPQVIAEIQRALKTGGLLWISDEAGEVDGRSALFSAALSFLLPTVISYPEKVRGLLKFGLRAPSRIKASMEAEDLSPFEGAGREHDWLQLVESHFTIEQRINSPAVTGYLAHQVKMPYRLALTILRGIRGVDQWLVRRRLLRNTGVVIFARKA